MCCQMCDSTTQVTGHGSRVTGRRSQVTDHRSQVTIFTDNTHPLIGHYFATHTQTRGGLDVPTHTTLHNPLGSSLGSSRPGVLRIFPAKLARQRSHRDKHHRLVLRLVVDDEQEVESLGHIIHGDHYKFPRSSEISRRFAAGPRPVRPLLAPSP